MAGNKESQKSSRYSIQRCIHPKGHDGAGKKCRPSSAERVKEETGRVRDEGRRSGMDHKEGEGDKCKETYTEVTGRSRARTRDHSKRRHKSSTPSKCRAP